MKMRLSILSIFALFVLATTSWGAGQNVSKDDAKSVPLFEAVDQGLVTVRLIPKNSLQSTVSVTNKSGEPLMVEMPAAFAGVPVLAQVGRLEGLVGAHNRIQAAALGGGGGMMGGGGGMMGGGGGMMGGGRMGGGGNQSVGGGMGGSGGMGGGGGLSPLKKLFEKPFEPFA